MEMLGEKEWFLLFQLSKMGALEGISKTTTDIATNLFISQQTVSRRLRSLKEKGLIINTLDEDKILIKISEKGKTALQSIYQDLKIALLEKTVLQFKGEVQSGLGEGKFYIQLPEYNIEFTNHLKKPPFPGTLNILLESENLEDFYYTLSQQQHHTIEGFQSDARTFGNVKCYNICLANNGAEVNCLLVSIHRTSHQKGVIEVVSHLNLRETLKLEDGSQTYISFCN
ncbi:MAG: DUF120 domain-containing protein [Promethearchaeota archaeon]